MTEIEWTDAELAALAAYRHAEAHEDARDAEEYLRGLVAAREAQAAAKALREAAEEDAITIPDVLGYKVPAVAVEDILNRADRIGGESS